jgi:putative oxidoreductase
MKNHRSEALLFLIGRALLSAIFLTAGVGKITAFAATQGYMESAGLPGALLPLVIVLELGGGLALLFGFRARVAAAALALFSLASAIVFHADFGDQAQSVMFLKNVAIAGGLMMIVAAGSGAWSFDRTQRA